jgi:hypothetical protein
MMSPKGTGIFRMEGSHQLILMGSFLHRSSDIGGFALQGITLRTSETVGKPQALHLLYEDVVANDPFRPK